MLCCRHLQMVHENCLFNKNKRMMNLLQHFKFKRFKKELAEKARVNGICSDWHQRILDAKSEDDLLQLYIKGIDFSINTRWLTPKFMKEKFSEEVRHKYGVYVDEDVTLENPKIIILNGKCKCTAIWSDWHCGDVYVLDNSHADLSVELCARITVQTYDNSDIRATTDSTSKIFVYNYGGIIKTDGDVIIRDKH